jgi:hypothetical protein
MGVYAQTLQKSPRLAGKRMIHNARCQNRESLATMRDTAHLSRPTGTPHNRLVPGSSPGGPIFRRAATFADRSSQHWTFAPTGGDGRRQEQSRGYGTFQHFLEATEASRRQMAPMSEAESGGNPDRLLRSRAVHIRRATVDDRVDIHVLRLWHVRAAHCRFDLGYRHVRRSLYRLK